MKTNSGSYKRYFFFLLIVFFTVSCSSTIHLLSSWGIPLESKADKEKAPVSFQKEESCQEMVSLIIKEQYLNKQELFEKSVARQHGDEDGKQIISNVNLLLSLDYSISVSRLLKMNSQNVNFKKDKIGNYFKNSSKDKFKGKSQESLQNQFSISLMANNYLLQSSHDLNLNLALELQEHYLTSSNTHRGLRENKAWGKILLSSANFKEQEESLQRNNYLKIQYKKGYLYYYYPDVSHLSDYVKVILDTKYVQLYKEIQKYNAESVGDELALNQRLLSSLTEHLFDEYNQFKSKTGIVKNVRMEKLYVEKITRFFLDFVSLMPFPNASKQIARDLAFNYLFHNAKLLKPRIYIPENVLVSGLSKWNVLVRKGMLKTVGIYDSILKRGELSLPISNTPELLTNVKSFDFDNLYQSENDTVKFKTFLRQTVEHNPNFIPTLVSNPFQFAREMSSKYTKYLNKHNLDKSSDYYVSDDFTHYFKKRAFRSQSLWSYKMDNFYKKTILWKDVKTVDGLDLGHSEIISLFKDLNKSLNSNQEVQTDLLLNSTLDNFDEFNQDVIRGGVGNVINELIFKGENCRNSYGFLTYKNLNALQDSVSKLAQKKLTIVVGLKKSTKDLDLKSYGKNKMIHNKVLTIGAVDPDAIMIIHTLNDKGKIISSYIRDQERPWRILIFEGKEDQGSYQHRAPASIINLSH